MILIISQSINEPSTEEVIDWIDYLGGKFCRINGDDICCPGGVSISIDNENTSFNLTYSKISNLNSFNIGWYRRWSNQTYLNPILNSTIDINKGFPLTQSIISDNNALKKYIIESIEVKKWLTHPFMGASVNKLKVLFDASKVGLKIPPSAVLTNKTNLYIFLSKFETIICKDISSPYTIPINGRTRITSKTTLLSKQNIDELPETFIPTLFQENIIKEFEIRSFFLEDTFYSMAIFSQNDKKTEVDFRNYNWENPNRVIPFKLPVNIEEKLKSLFSNLKLVTGSVDLILTKKNEYYFLEINPVGQFGMTSYPCNYNLEKKIAEYLIKNDF